MSDEKEAAWIRFLLRRRIVMSRCLHSIKASLTTSVSDLMLVLDSVKDNIKYIMLTSLLGFDKSRTQSRCLNKVVYCWEGFKKMFIRTSKMKQVVEAVHVTQTEIDINQVTTCFCFSYPEQ
jgi:hypothetical protein